MHTPSISVFLEQLKLLTDSKLAGSRAAVPPSMLNDHRQGAVAKRVLKHISTFFSFKMFLRSNRFHTAYRSKYYHGFFFLESQSRLVDWYDRVASIRDFTASELIGVQTFEVCVSAPLGCVLLGRFVYKWDSSSGNSM